MLGDECVAAVNAETRRRKSSGSRPRKIQETQLKSFPHYLYASLERRETFGKEISETNSSHVGFIVVARELGIAIFHDAAACHRRIERQMRVVFKVKLEAVVVSSKADPRSYMLRQITIRFL